MTAKKMARGEAAGNAVARPDPSHPLVLASLYPAELNSESVREIAWSTLGGAGFGPIERYFLAQGRAPAPLLDRLASAAGGALYSEFPTLDAIRLDRLHAEVGLTRRFALMAFGPVLDSLAEPGLVEAARTAAERHVGARAGAAAELEVLVETYRLCRLYSRRA
jgi:hypothetical protein